MFLTKNIARRSATIFLVCGLTWIIAGDFIVNWIAITLNLPIDSITAIQIIKGIVFVCIASLVLFFTLQIGVRQLKSSRKEYKDLFRHNPVAMIVFRIESGEILAVNNAACKQYGYSESEFLRMDINSFRSKHDADQLHNQIAANLRSITDIGTWKHIRKNNQEFWVHIFACKTTFKRIDARLVLAFDVNTEMENRERLEKQNKRLANISWFHSHDLRAYIARIQGLLSLVNYQDPADPSNPEILIRLKSTAEDLDELIKRTSRISFPADEGPSQVA